MKNNLSRLPLRTFLVLLAAMLVLTTLGIVIIEYRGGHTRESLIILGFVLVLLLALTAIAIVRLGVPLRRLRKRLNTLLEKHFPDAMARLPHTENNEYAHILAILRLLEEHMGMRGMLMKLMPQSVIMCDSTGTIILFNPSAELMLGYSASEVVGKQTPLLFHDLDEMRRRAEELSREWGCPAMSGFPALIARAKMSNQVDEREWTYVRKDGSRLRALISITAFEDDQESTVYCCVATDVTQSSLAAEEMLRLANHDPLTQLPNRRLFEDRMRMTLTLARRENTRFALLMIDLDRFKPVNDRYGHSAGDLLLCAVAERMRECLRESDTLARLGGDEFVAILPKVEETNDARSAAEKIRMSLGQPFQLSDSIIVDIDCSIGLGIYPEHGGDETLLQKSADEAMYIAKGLGRGQVYVAGDAHKSGTDVDGNEPAEKDRIKGLLTWRPAFQCGKEEIDKDHKQLFVYGNAIIRGAASGKLSPEKLSEMLYQLIGLIAVHFRNEESVLAHYGYAGLTVHAQKHLTLVEHAQALYRQSVERNLPIDEVVSFVTQEVVGQHILHDDRRFFPFLRKAIRQEEDAKIAEHPS